MEGNKELPKFTHEGKNKKKFVREMFNDISSNYDFLNHFLSLGIDIYWRKKFVRKLNISHGDHIADIACGTGDVCFEILRNHKANVTGIDLAENMISIASEKAQKKQVENVQFLVGDAEDLPLDSNSVDFLTISYGFRNIAHYEKAIEEFLRVLKPGGMLGILEFSKPKNSWLGSLFTFYFHQVLPRLGSLFSRSDAYRYLPESVDFFPSREDICRKLIYGGFHRAEIHDLTLGISTIFLGFKSHEY